MSAYSGGRGTHQELMTTAAGASGGSPLSVQDALVLMQQAVRSGEMQQVGTGCVHAYQVLPNVVVVVFRCPNLCHQYQHVQPLVSTCIFVA